MADSVFMTVFCKLEDTPRFEAIGFVEQHEEQAPGLAYLTNEWADYDDLRTALPTDIVFSGSRDGTWDAEPESFCCDGEVFSVRYTTSEGKFFVSVEKNGGLNYQELDGVKAHIFQENRVAYLLDQHSKACSERDVASNAV